MLEGDLCLLAKELLNHLLFVVSSSVHLFRSIFFTSIELQTVSAIN